MRVSYILLVVGAVACSSAATPRESPFAELKGPAGPRSGEPFLSVDARDRLHMTWLEQTGESTFAVRYARLDDSTWSAPSTIAERTDLFVNWADFPAVVASPSGRLVAHSGLYACSFDYPQTGGTEARSTRSTLIQTTRMD